MSTHSIDTASYQKIGHSLNNGKRPYQHPNRHQGQVIQHYNCVFHLQPGMSLDSTKKNKPNKKVEYVIWSGAIINNRFYG